MASGVLDREAMRKLLKQIEEWCFPPSQWESDLVRDILKMPAVTVRRALPEKMRQLGFFSHECHENARFYAEFEPSGLTKVVTGWWIQDNVLVLHSVVENDGTMICITPSPHNEETIDFIPDREIRWIETDDLHSAERNGQIVGVGLRMFPEATIRHQAIIREHLLAGVNPDQAAELTAAEMEELQQIAKEARGHRT